jgi:hypothetical protein
MEPEDLLPRSQAPAIIVPCSEPDQSSPCRLFLLSKIQCINPSAPRSSKWSLSFMFSRDCHVFRQSYPRLFYQRNDVWRAVQIVKLPIRQFSLAPVRSTSSLLCSHMMLSSPFSTNFSLCSVCVDILLLFCWYCYSWPGGGRRLARVPERGGTGPGTHPEYPQGGEQAVREMERPHRPLGPMAAEIRWQSCGKWPSRICTCRHRPW